jgi:serine/threonine protein kinase
MTIGIVGMILGLRYLDFVGVVHGALCPANVLLSENLEPKLGPPGCARLNDLAVAPYIAPELRAGHQPSAASDVFALAVTLYEVVTDGRRAFPVDSIEELAALQSSWARPLFPECIDLSVASLLGQAWSPVPSERPTIFELRNAVMEVGCLPITLEDVDGKAVVEYVTRVVGWETQQGVYDD